MGKPRVSKRQLIRDEKRAKKRRAAEHDDQQEDDHAAKRSKVDNAGAGVDSVNAAEGEIHFPEHAFGKDEKEFYGHLNDEEKEYFTNADTLLELNDFPSAEDREIFLRSVWKEAEGKELKLACSQSCSRLTERLISLSTTRQKKRLFEAFAGHFPSLITHRFASHCCEKLFVQSAPVVTRELGGNIEEEEDGEEENNTGDVKSMEQLFLLAMDEMDGYLTNLMSDTYGSHTLRVLIIVLSGRPFDSIPTKSLLQSKNKEHVTVQGAFAFADESNSQVRAVPSSFAMAIEKIIADINASMDPISLRVLAKHPTGNPVLQLLLELELSSKEGKSKGSNAKKGAEKQENANEEGHAPTLLEQLVPGAPLSFSEPSSEATEFVNTMLYDSVGSRLLEVITTHGPGKIFKALYSTFFGPRIHSLLRNEIASYPAIRALNRISKDDLVDAVEKCIPEVAAFVERRRFNVVKALFERCQVRGAPEQIDKLLKALTISCGGNWKFLVPKLCLLDEEKGEKAGDKRKEQFQQHQEKGKATLVNHGTQLLMTLLGIPGQASKAVQASLLALNPDQLFHMATAFTTTSQLLQKAFETAAETTHFHKLLAGNLARHAVELADSVKGQYVLISIISTPCKDDMISVPFHLKENIMTVLAKSEGTLRESKTGRNVWRAWKGDWFGNRPADWTYWVKKGGPSTQ